MDNFLNKIVRHYHSLLIDYDQLALTLKVLDEFGITWKNRLRTGNCKLAKAPTCWFVNFTVSDEKWYSILKRFKEEGVNLLPETVGY